MAESDPFIVCLNEATVAQRADMILSRSSNSLVAKLGVSRGHVHQTVHASKSPPCVSAHGVLCTPAVSAICFLLLVVVRGGGLTLLPTGSLGHLVPNKAGR